jgi:hypothetical protein
MFAAPCVGFVDCRRANVSRESAISDPVASRGHGLEIGSLHGDCRLSLHPCLLQQQARGRKNAVFQAHAEPERKHANRCDPLAMAAASNDLLAALQAVRRCAGYTQDASAYPGWDYSAVLL